MKVEIVDYLVFLTFILFLLYVGFRCKKQMHSADDFFLIGQRVPGWVIAISLLSLWMTAFDVIGLSALTADYGIVSLHYFWLGSIPAIAFLVLCVIPVFRNAGVRSLPEYLGKRFDSSVRLLGSYLYMGLVSLFSSFNLFLGAKALSYFIPAPPAVYIIAMTAVAVAYLCMGGLSAAILNSILLVCMIVFAFAPLTVLGFMHFMVLDKNWLPNLDKFIIELMDKSYYQLWSPLFKHNSLGLKWDFIFTGLVLGLSLGMIALDYAFIQRLSCLKDETEAKKAALTSAFWRMISPVFLILPTLFAVACMPELQEKIVDEHNSPISVLPLLIANWYPAGMLGISICGIVASVFCSVQAASMVFSSAYVRDVQTDAGVSSVKKARNLTIFSGAVFAAMAIVISVFPGSADYIQTVFTFVGVPLTAVTVCGLLWPGCTTKGAKAGLIGGAIIATFHYFGSILSSIAPNLLPLGIGALVAPLKSYLSFFAFRSVFASNLSRAFFVFVGAFILAVGCSGKQDKTDEEIDTLTFHPTSMFARNNRAVLLSVIGLFIFMALLNVALW